MKKIKGIAARRADRHEQILQRNDEIARNPDAETGLRELEQANICWQHLVNLNIDFRDQLYANAGFFIYFLNQNQSICLEALNKLGQDFRKELYENADHVKTLLSNTNLSLEALSQLAQDFRKELLHNSRAIVTLVNKANIPLKLLCYLGRDFRSELYANSESIVNFMKNSSISLEYIYELRTRTQEQDRLFYSELHTNHKAIVTLLRLRFDFDLQDLETLSKLDQDFRKELYENADDVKALLSNTNLSLEALSKLAQDCRKKLYKNADCVINHLKQGPKERINSIAVHDALMSLSWFSRVKPDEKPRYASDLVSEIESTVEQLFFQKYDTSWSSYSFNPGYSFSLSPPYKAQKSFEYLCLQCRENHRNRSTDPVELLLRVAKISLEDLRNLYQEDYSFCSELLEKDDHVLPLLRSGISLQDLRNLYQENYPFYSELLRYSDRVAEILTFFRISLEDFKSLDRDFRQDLYSYYYNEYDEDRRPVISPVESLSDLGVSLKELNKMPGNFRLNLYSDLCLPETLSAITTNTDNIGLHHRELLSEVLGLDAQSLLEQLLVRPYEQCFNSIKNKVIDRFGGPNSFDGINLNNFNNIDSLCLFILNYFNNISAEQTVNNFDELASNAREVFRILKDWRFRFNIPLKIFFELKSDVRFSLYSRLGDINARFTNPDSHYGHFINEGLLDKRFLFNTLVTVDNNASFNIIRNEIATGLNRLGLFPSNVNQHIKASDMNSLRVLTERLKEIRQKAITLKILSSKKSASTLVSLLTEADIRIKILPFLQWTDNKTENKGDEALGFYMDQQAEKYYQKLKKRPLWPS